MIGAPLLLGLLVAPSPAGGWVALGALGMFLARQPLKIAGKDLVQGKRFPRTRWAFGFGVGLLCVALGALAFAIAGSSKPLWLPLLVLGVLSCIQFGHDVMGRGRSAVPEVAGACAAATFAPLIALAGGVWEREAWLLGAVLALHALLAVVYVSSRLALVRGGSPSVPAVWVLAAGATALAAAMVALGWARWPLLAAFAVLAGRALWGVSRWRAEVRPQVVGFQETGYALGLVLSTALFAGIASSA
ncbi:MAG: YwiC-like family protein [Fimbriimonadaceae bacterium]|nr:YwiC-like family protein [Fimbriimonadaceae bacterium]